MLKNQSLLTSTPEEKYLAFLNEGPSAKFGPWESNKSKFITNCKKCVWGICKANVYVILKTLLVPICIFMKQSNNLSLN